MSRPNRRLGYVLKRYPRLSETFIAAEIIELERQGESVTILAISRPDESVGHAFVHDVRANVVYLPHRPLFEPLRVVRAFAFALATSPRLWLRAAATCLRAPWTVNLRRLSQATVLRHELHVARIDHVHAHFATAASRLASLVRLMGGPTYSVTAHAKDIYQREVRPDHLREKLAGAAFVATVSQANRAYLDELLGGCTPLHVVANSVDAARIQAAGTRRPESDLVLSVARLVEKKGLADVVEACAQLRQAGRRPRLVIVGDGPLRASLESLAVERGVAVTFTGPIPHEEVIQLYRRAAAFCLPCVVAADGDRDGMPTSVLEAMAAGVPVVTTALNGLSEAVLDGRTGLIVPPSDPAAVAAALERLMADPSAAAELGLAGRAHVERSFATSTSVGRLRSLFPAAV